LNFEIKFKFALTRQTSEWSLRILTDVLAYIREYWIGKVLPPSVKLIQDIPRILNYLPKPTGKLPYKNKQIHVYNYIFLNNCTFFINTSFLCRSNFWYICLSTEVMFMEKNDKKKYILDIKCRHSSALIKSNKIRITEPPGYNLAKI
jgi:hypothetical protein